ncbi:hypothetical protein FA95DRAFT_1564945 [Auriscalpium vulgare]|uniref:Uncharacterized protein n=1 Tax=Auriscalpium vulgare TaxID=40419 RepID=A0ACB8RCG3_9AGAM|nr:hypothetical protein FA95DRAFT_1564945 [Auriscalpium vulgare]
MTVAGPTTCLRDVHVFLNSKNSGTRDVHSFSTLVLGLDGWHVVEPPHPDASTPAVSQPECFVGSARQKSPAASRLWDTPRCFMHTGSWQKWSTAIDRLGDRPLLRQVSRYLRDEQHRTDDCAHTRTHPNTSVTSWCGFELARYDFASPRR